MLKKIKWIPPLFVQIYLLFILSLGIGGIVTYLTNINNLRKNEEIILKQVVFFAQQSLLELMRQNFIRLENVSNEFGYTITSGIPKNAIILLDNTDSFAEIKLFKFQKNYGFSLEYLGVEFVAFKDFSEELTNGIGLNIWLFLGFLVLLLTFAMILTLLQPLRVLQSALDAFGRGNYKVRIPIPKEPQQAELAQSFNTMCAKISRLMAIRTFVLRNIGHELKTPISKAKLALELMGQNPQKEVLQRCISNLDGLTSQILTFEKVQEGRDLLHLETFDVETLLLKTLEQLFLEEELLEIVIVQNFKITGDLQFLSIALKNLIENAKKYKSSGKINIIADNQRISVKNLGNALEKDIDYYLEPFARDSAHTLIQGYGLGLGIIKGVLELHYFALEYVYKEGTHCFTIILEPRVES